MGKYCSNCGRELQEDMEVCLSCGKILKNIQQNYVPNYNVNNQANDGKALATISVVFGALGFYPLAFIGAIVGFVTGLIGLYDQNNQYKQRCKIGIGLSIGAFAFWLIIFFLVLLFPLHSPFYWFWRLNS